MVAIYEHGMAWHGVDLFVLSLVLSQNCARPTILQSTVKVYKESLGLLSKIEVGVGVGVGDEAT